VKKIHQIWISDNDAPPPESVSKKIHNLKLMYSDCEYHMYNQSSLLDFIKENFDPTVAQAFVKIKPYAFKADLGRYCLLYMHGGYYFDAAICPQFRYEHNDYAFILQGESPTIDSKLCHALDNGIMYFDKPFDPFLKSAIEKTVENILGENYGRNPTDVTGPLMLYNLDHSRIKKFPCSVVEGKKVTCIDEKIWFEYQHGFSAAPAKKSEFWVNNPKISEAEAKGTNSYSKMWLDKNIFKKDIIKKVHQIYISEDNKPPSAYIQEQMAKVKELYSDWEYNLYDNERCREVIDSIFGKKIVNVYDSLNTFAYRADFARYCILYKYGGQYFDASICPELKLNFEDTSILYKPPVEWGAVELIDNGVMIFNETQHPLLLKAIQVCIKNIRSKNYGNGSLDITGPAVLGKIDKYDDVTYGYCKYITPKKQKAAFLGDVMHWKYKPEGTHLESFGCSGVNNYDKMWLEKKVFK
jgi:mannosyltransferase OCH1-like enzyme